MINIKNDKGNYLEIFSNEFKILEHPNNMLWNTDENHVIAVDKVRYENGDYELSNIPAEPITEEELQYEGVQYGENR